MQTLVLEAGNSIQRLAGRLIAWGIPVLYFLIAVAFYLHTYDSAQIKITLVQMGGTLLIAAWLIKLVEEDAVAFFRRNGIVLLPLAAFLVSGIVSYAQSPFPYASLQELIRRVLYIGMATVVVAEFNSREKINRLFAWLCAAAAVVTIYGAVQYLDYHFFPAPPEPGLDPFIWRRAFAERIFSTFGNPNFFGDFLVVMSPIVLALFLYQRRFSRAVLWLLIAFGVIFTYSKGAWLGFAAGLVAFTFFTVGFFTHANKARVRKILLVMLAATLLIVGLGMRHQLKGRPDSSSFRIFTWLSTWEMINTRPWLGTGIGTFYVTYPAWRRPQIFFIEGRHNTETDHPEDEFLEVWYDEGLIGFGIFLLLIAMVLTLGFRNLRHFTADTRPGRQPDKRAYLQLGVLTSLIAQLIHNFVCVSLRFVSSGVMLWLMIGLTIALFVHSPLPDAAAEPPVNTRLPRAARRLLQLLIAGAAAWCLWIFAGFFNADVHHNMGIFHSKQSQWDAALANYQVVADKNPSFIMSHYFMGNVYNDRWGAGDPERSVAKYDDVWKLAPNYVQSHHQAGLIYLKWGESEQRLAAEARARGDQASAAEHERKLKDIWQKALAQFERYRELDPIYPLNYYRMAWIYTQMGRPDKAEEMYRAHLEYPEKLKQPPHNAWVENWAARRSDEYAETCVNLGNSRYMQNDLAGAERYYRRALELNPNAVNAMKNIAIVAQRKGDAALWREMWGKVRAVAPQDPDVQRMLAQK